MNDAASEQNPTDPISVLIADDHALVRTGLSMLLEDESDMVVVGEASDGAEALALAKELHPAVVLADLNMPPPDGIELARQLTDCLPATKTIIVTMHEDRAMVDSAIAAGAAGYVLKRAAGSELVDAIRMALTGLRYIDPKVTPYT